MRALTLCLAVLTLSCAGAQQPKKLLEYGWDVPYPDQVRANIRKMEERPFDGLVFRLREYNHLFDPRRWDEAALQPQVDDLKAIEWQRFTDNFLTLYAANDRGMDWFSDEQWRNIEHNVQLYTRAAKAARCVGLMFDPEPYGDNPWVYPGKNEGKSFDEVNAVVRRRGAQFMRAVQTELPNVRLLSLWHLGLFADIVGVVDPARRQDMLSRHGYALMPAFINGMLDVANPGARLIDGNEMAYYYSESEQYFRAYHLMRQRVLSLVAPENQDKWRQVGQAGNALYVDQQLALRQPATGYLAGYLSPTDRLSWFQHNVYWSLYTADEYVWLYSEKMNWWTGPVPDGLEDAVRAARAKVQSGQPLGFDLQPALDAGQKQWDEAIAARVKQRTATLQPLAAGTPAPALDGKLDDAAWRGRELEPFQPSAASMKDALEGPTTAWVTYDANHLYLAFRCVEPKLGEMVISGKNRDDSVWYGETAELFLSEGEAAVPFRHFIVNPDGVQWDGRSTADGDDVAWNGTWRAAVGREAEPAAWTVELAIPWADLGGRPAPGSTRRVNLNRARVAGRELSGWSGVVSGFVDPPRFGTWVFGR